jgi:hypothetical protein
MSIGFFSFVDELAEAASKDKSAATKPLKTGSSQIRHRVD